jgi:hypothetical protein
MNRAILAAFLCSAAPATMCEGPAQMSPFESTQWPTLSGEDPAMARARAASTTSALGALSLPDYAIALIERPDVDKQPISTTVLADRLPSTSTAPEPELQSRLLIACLGLVLAVAGGVMLLVPRR